MTTQVRALIFDDEEAQLNEVEFSLRHLWDDFRLPGDKRLPPLAIERVSDKSELQKILAHSKLDDTYDVFFCDVLIGAPGQSPTTSSDPAGFGLMKVAKNHGMPLCFALSTGAKNTDAFNTAHDSYKKYIDQLFWKASLYGSKGDEEQQKTFDEIVRRLLAKGILPSIAVKLLFDNSIQEARTLGIRSDLGDQVIQSFAAEVAFENANSVSVSSLSPGLSGAKILKLTYSEGPEDYSSRPILLKVSRDRPSLAKERENYEKELRIPDRRVTSKVARPVGKDADRILEHSGWHAIAFQCAAPAQSLLDWLLDPARTAEDTPAFLENLFFDGGLSDMYVTTKYDGPKVLDNVSSSLLSEYRKMAILDAIQEFSGLIMKHCGAQHADSVDLSDLSTFIVDTRLNGLDSQKLSRKVVRSCLVHGDFHGRNVLATHTGVRWAPTIIDVASMRRAMWCTDIVRLICDLFTSGWDRGEKSYEWDGMPEWLAAISALIAARVDGDAQATQALPNARLKQALDWLFANRFNIAGLEGDSHQQGEFSLCLAVEFARAAYRDRDLTAPKRALSLAAAALLITDAKEKLATR